MGKKKQPPPKPPHVHFTRSAQNREENMIKVVDLDGNCMEKEQVSDVSGKEGKKDVSKKVFSGNRSDSFSGNQYEGFVHENVNDKNIGNNENEEDCPVNTEAEPIPTVSASSTPVAIATTPPNLSPPIDTSVHSWNSFVSTVRESLNEDGFNALRQQYRKEQQMALDSALKSAAHNNPPGMTCITKPIGANGTGLDSINNEPVSAAGPDSVLPLANGIGPNTQATSGLNKEINVEPAGPVFEPIILPDNLDIGPLAESQNINIGLDDHARAQETFASVIKKGTHNPNETLSPHCRIFGNFESCIKFVDNIPEVDPLRGSKFWNQELFQKLVAGVDVDDSETRLAYDPPNRNETGVFEINIEGHFMKKSYSSQILQLYGYFIGATLPFRVVKENLIKMWHQYGLKSINMNRGGYYFFKFENEDGMLQVLERNPWLVDNVPLVLQVWEPDVVLNKPKPQNVPIWVAIKDLPLSLWNGGNIGQIVSCVGKPLMLDQATFKRCESKEGPMNYARVLVDAIASNGLPDKVKLNLPTSKGTPGKSYFLDLSYKWKPPICRTCNVFGHVDGNCEKKAPVEPLFREEMAQKPVYDIQKAGKGKAQETDGFIEVKRKQDRPKKSVWQPKQAVKTGPVLSAMEFPPLVKESGPSNCSGPSRAPPVLTSKQAQNDAGPLGPSVKGSGSSKSLNNKCPTVTTNRFARLSDEEELEDCFDADLGLWDYEIKEAHKYVDSKTRPPDDDSPKWSDRLKDYFEKKLKERLQVASTIDDEQEVESENDESARFMALG